MNVRATAKFVGTSHRKVGLVAAIIRGHKAKEAVMLLNQTPQRATEPVGKVLNSAIANAENNYRLKVADLMVESVLVGPGPTLKRFRPRAQGRAFPILKRTSHITVVLSDGSAKQVAAEKSTTPAASTSELATTPTASKAKPAKGLRPSGDAKANTRSQALARRTNQRKGNA